MSKKRTTQEFIKKARGRHGNRYDYSRSVYLGSIIKISIICFKHGEFFQAAGAHIRGYGCKYCGWEYGHEKLSKRYKGNPSVWSHRDWKNSADKSKSFDSFKVYLIKCSNNSEVFYKIGKTYRKINKRFQYRIPYKFRVIETIVGSALHISKLELIIQKENEEFKYIPSIPFNGRHECFSSPPQKPLLEYQKQLLQIN